MKCRDARVAMMRMALEGIPRANELTNAELLRVHSRSIRHGGSRGTAMSLAEIVRRAEHNARARQTHPRKRA